MVKLGPGTLSTVFVLALTFWPGLLCHVLSPQISLHFHNHISIAISRLQSMYEDPSSLASISKRLNSICYTCLPFLTSPRKSHNIKTHPDISCQNVHVQSIIVILVDYFEDEVMTIVYCLDRFEVFRLLISLLVGLDSTGC